MKASNARRYPGNPASSIDLTLPAFGGGRPLPKRDFPLPRGNMPRPGPRLVMWWRRFAAWLDAIVW